ncbi:MAG: nucleic acid-binding protein [Betaproteobacteria bacterium]
MCLPEICDYEVRRELIRASKTKGLARLDQLKGEIDYIPITTAMMLKAAEFWATARNQGTPTAPKDALDADVILAAQAALSAHEDEVVVIATTNVGHLAQFADSRNWRDIAPA